MNIPIKVNKDFEKTLNTIISKYGEDFEYLNGFHESQLNFSDFIDGFIDKNVADATIDSNANARHKDICSMRSEKGKSEDKLFAFNKIFYELKKKYGLRTAKEWLDTEINGGFYLHDAPSSTYVPYSYKGTETVVVDYKGKIHLIPFSDLYELVEEKEELLSEEDMAFCKYTNDLKVWDKDNTWSKVIRVIKKPKTTDFHFIKANNGISEIVTSNHPVITTEGDVYAKDITTDHIVITQPYNQNFGVINKIYCIEELLKLNKPITFRGELVNKDTDIYSKGQVCYFQGTNPIQNVIDLDFDFGWLVGILIADGFRNHDCINITQNKGEIYDNIIRILEDKGYGYTISSRENGCNVIKVRSQVLSDIIFECFITGKYSWNVHLRSDILKYNKTFIKGIISGVLDGDGTLTQAQGRRIHIRTTSRALMNQLSFIIRMFGYTVREQTPSMYFRKESYQPKNYIYHLAFTPYNDVENFDSIKIRNHNIEYTSKSEEGRYTNGKYSFGFGEKQVTNNIILDKDTDEYVYDISVETGHFMCNNILSHNCYAYDLTRLAKEGLFFLDDYNNESPKHLTTFLDDVVEFISFFSNRSSGACGLPNILLWTFYFWKKDCKEGYYIKNPDYYIKQCFQKFIYRVNQPFLRVDQTAFLNCSIFGRPYLEALFGGVEFPDGTYAIDYLDELIEHQKIFMEVISDIRSKNMFTFPVLTYSLLYKDGKFQDEEFARWCSDHNTKWNDSNFFMSDNVGVLSNCCRLLSDTSKLSGFINSIGGTALSIGSVKVNTINLMRIAYETECDEKKYLKILRRRTELCCKVLDVIRHIIKRNVEKGLLPNYVDGGIEMDKQYSTVGILGLFEVIEAFRYTTKDEFGNIYYTDQGIEFASKIFDVLNDVKDNFTDEYSFNVESVPAERAAVILCQKDNLLYEKNDKFIYSNQWIPLSEKCTIQEKLRLSSILDIKCSGGSIAHINLEQNFPNTDVAWDMLNKIAESGVIYFAFNTRINECDNHHGFVGTDVCPECGHGVYDTYQRIVGFLEPVRSYSKDRKKEFSTRQWYSYAQMKME